MNIENIAGRVRHKTRAKWLHACMLFTQAVGWS